MLLSQLRTEFGIVADEDLEILTEVMNELDAGEEGA